MAIRIMLVDDHQIVREGLRGLLVTQAGWEVVGEASNGRAAVAMANRLKPHVVVMDVAMPDVNGVEATRQVLAQDDSIKVLGLSMHADAAFVAEMLQAGAVGYLLKDCAFDELVNAVRAVVGGQTYLSPTITGSLVESYVRRPARPAAAAAPLGSKDRELVRMLAEGLSVEEIAKKRRTQAKAVDSQRIQVMERLGLRNIADLVKYAIREGLTRLD